MPEDRVLFTYLRPLQFVRLPREKGACATSRKGSCLQLHPLQFTVQRLAFDTQDLRGAALIAARSG
jgi:hypothetical protein